MFKLYYLIMAVTAGIILLNITVKAQVTQSCGTTIQNGQNLTKNGDFTAGNDGSFTFTPAGAGGYTYFTCADAFPSSSCYSNPGKIWVGPSSDWFNQAFNVGASGFGNPIKDHSPTSDNNFLMVDGVCQLGINAWSQQVTVVPGTWYYFECYVTNLNRSGSSTDLAILNFDINGDNLTLTTGGSTFTTSSTQGIWQVVTATWQCPPGVTSASISIQNTTTGSACNTGVDFGLDDITFTPGCAFADASTQQPALSSTGTLCGTGGAGLTLNPGTPSSYIYEWKNSAGTQLSTSSTYKATSAGTYVVCVKNGSGGCLKSDVITITGNYTLALPNPVKLCDPPSITLNPGFNGPGVTFKWLSSDNGTKWDTIKGTLGVAPTYTANSAKYYKVIANDPTPGCGEVISNVSQITTLQTAVPKDAYFCAPGTAKLSVTGPSTSIYKWYASPTSTSVLQTGTSYTTPSISTAMTYYVEDATVYNTTMGKAAISGTYGNRSLDQYKTAFTAKQGFIIDSVTVYWWMNTSNPNDPITVQIQLTDNPGGTTAPSVLASGVAFSTTNSAAQAMGIITPKYPTAGVQIYAVRVPVKITVPAAGTYRLTAKNGATGNAQIENPTTAPYPIADGAGGTIATITGTSEGGNPVGSAFYGGLYNWKILYNLNCERIPVKATPDCTQPLEFIYFGVKQGPDKKILLTWITAFEKNTNQFVVEKSFNGIDFYAIGTLNAAGESSTPLTYTFPDIKTEGEVYYRVNEIDNDGTVYKTQIKSIKSGNAGSIKIWPNPSKGKFNLIVTGIEDSDYVNLELTNTIGQTVLDLVEKRSGTIFSSEINHEDLAPGIYIMNVRTDKDILTEKIIVE
ncbi:MAG: T9SS type A sorting domain-containing protein [Sporocytophaga sp.]|nr:T9SS type A sorting domain-containing protein [Sporocytophaga sp.]